MKTLEIFLALLALPILSFAQNDKGVTPVGTPAGATAGATARATARVAPAGPTTRALVIGISDYQDLRIPDLQFADKDAEAFAAWLHAYGGGHVPTKNIRLLLNEQATGGNINAALDWLLDETGEGDSVIIYFSGHGDMNAKIRGQLGYLLLWDSYPHVYTMSALSVNVFQNYVTTLSLDNHARVWVVADACRAGKMAGSELIAAQLTNANLAVQFANEIKILSCQPNEYSVEGRQWGGGRGVFSYYLLDGLLGRADANHDSLISLVEIGHYLQDRVPPEVAPLSQIPMTIGDKKLVVARVDPALAAEPNPQLPVFTAVEQRGLVQEVLAKVDSSILQLYQAYLEALDEKRLLQPAGNCADHYFMQLLQIDRISAMHPALRRNFAAALQDDAQQAINAYLDANPTELRKRHAQDPDYGRFPEYLHRAADILGEQNYYYPSLMAKLYYFEGLGLRLEAERHPGQDSLYRQAIQKQQKALDYEHNASFAFNELGVLYTRLKQDDKAVECLEKAIELAPKWGLPYVNYSVLNFYTGNYEKAIEYG